MNQTTAPYQQTSNRGSNQVNAAPLPEIDFWASPAYGEVTCPATPAHSSFLLRLKKGLACAMLFLLTTIPAMAQVQWGEGKLYEVDPDKMVDTTLRDPLPDGGTTGLSFWDYAENTLLIGLLVLVGIFLVYCLFAGHNKRMKSLIAQPEPKPTNALPDDECVFEMRITNDLGDTIAPGDCGMELAARIVKRDRQGREETDFDLTQRIVAQGNGFLVVSAQQMRGGKMVAYFSTANAVPPPQTAWVAFTIPGQTDHYTARIHFKVQG